MDIFTDKHSGYRFCMKTGNGCANYILQHGINEYSLIKWCEQFLTPQSTFVDIGAHMGTYSVILSYKCNTVWAFEAQKTTFTCLNLSVISNKCTNIITKNVALGSENGTATLHHVSEDGGGSTLKRDIADKAMNILEEETVNMRTLDSFDIKNVDFIKIDVEGFELEVIKGATTTLKNNKYPPFIFEAWDDLWYQDEKKKLLEYIISLGYKVCSISGVSNMFLASDHPSRQN